MALDWAYTGLFVLDWVGEAIPEGALFDSSRKIRIGISTISHYLAVFKSFIMDVTEMV